MLGMRPLVWGWRFYPRVVKVYSMLLQRAIAFIFLVFFAVVLQAAVVPNLYTATLPTSSQSVADQDQLIKAAFQMVLVKVSGNPDFVKTAGMNNLLKHAGDYVTKYGFMSSGEHSATPYLFQATFAAKEVNQVLNQYGQAIWMKDRPLVLVWVITRDKQGLRFASENDANSILTLVKDNFDRRGIPLMTPLFDLADLQKTNASTFEAMTSEQVRQLSARYLPSVILVLTIDSSDSQLAKSHWQVLFPQTEMHWDLSNSTDQQGINEGSDRVLKAIAQQFVASAVERTMPQTNVTLSVIGLKGFESYGKTLRYLRSLNQVTSVEVSHASSNQADFVVVFQGGLERFKQMLQLSTLIKPVDGNAALLVYQFTG